MLIYGSTGQKRYGASERALPEPYLGTSKREVPFSAAPLTIPPGGCTRGDCMLMISSVKKPLLMTPNARLDLSDGNWNRFYRLFRIHLRPIKARTGCERAGESEEQRRRRGLCRTTDKRICMESDGERGRRAFQRRALERTLKA